VYAQAHKGCALMLGQRWPIRRMRCGAWQSSWSARTPLSTLWVDELWSTLR